MPLTIHKFQFPTQASTLNPIPMPTGAQTLKVAHDANDDLCIWALVDPDAPVAPRIFEVVGTGWNFDPVGKDYIETIFQDMFVWHIWEHVT